MPDMIAVGEILIDLTQTGVNEQGIPQFAANPGGAPANVAVAAAKLGSRTAFVGKVGQDGFGRFLAQTLDKNGVDTRWLATDSQGATTLAVVTVDGTGERSFTFYRENSADTRLTAQDVTAAPLTETLFYHFGSVSLTAEPERSATLVGAERAKAAGALISYDPNYRPNLWPDEATAVTWMKHPLPLVDVLKVSDEELPLLTGTADLEEGSRLLAQQGISLVLVTLGAKGAYYRLGEETGLVPGVPVQVADTNGAGDTFLGAVIAQLCRRETPGLSGLTGAALREIVAFANRAAALTTSRSGAIPAMPTWKEVH